MGKPFVPKEDYLQNIACELISTMSSLNMYPAPVDNLEDTENGRPFYLSETDANARHAMEHLQELLSTVRRASHAKDRLKSKLSRMMQSHEITSHAYETLRAQLKEL